MSVSDDDEMMSIGDDDMSHGDDMSSYNMSKDNSISNSSTKIESYLTEEDARRILNNIFDGHINKFDSESLCTIIQTLETTGHNSTCKNK